MYDCEYLSTPAISTLDTQILPEAYTFHTDFKHIKINQKLKFENKNGTHNHKPIK